MLREGGHAGKYVLGLDPGARNLGYAASGRDDIGGVIDLGHLLDVPLTQCVAHAVRCLDVYLKDPMCIAGAAEEVFVSPAMPRSILLKLGAIFGAIETAFITNGKPFHARPSQEVKRAFGWRYLGGYEQNKAWSLAVCGSHWPRWYDATEAHRTDHACDAKLLAEYVTSQHPAYEQACRPAQADSGQASGAPACEE
jgi:hypothetical protein